MNAWLYPYYDSSITDAVKKVFWCGVSVKMLDILVLFQICIFFVLFVVSWIYTVHLSFPILCNLVLNKPEIYTP